MITPFLFCFLYLCFINSVSSGVSQIYSLVKSFPPVAGIPLAPLYHSPTDGLYYTTTSTGGKTNDGALISISFFNNFSDANITVIHSFDAATTGYSPASSVVEYLPTGLLIGTCQWGGISGDGTVWSYNRITSQMTVLISFEVFDNGEKYC